MYSRLLIFLIFIFCHNFVFAASRPLAWTVNNSLQFQRIATVIVSPSGNAVAFIDLKMVTKQKKIVWHASLYVKRNHTAPILISKKDYAVSQPHWSPDGNAISYLNNVAPHNSDLIIRNSKSGKLIKKIAIPYKVVTYRWSNNGKALAVVIQKVSPLNKKNNKPINHAKLIDSNQLYVVKLDHHQDTVTHWKQLSLSSQSITMFDPYVGGIAWSPNNQAIAFAYHTSSDLRMNTNSTIEIKQIRTGNSITIPFTKKYASNDPHFSPNGKWLAFRASLSPSKNAKLLSSDINLNSRICVTNVKTLQTHCLANTFNQNPTLLGWSANSKAVYVFDSYKHTATQFYKISVSSNSHITHLSDVAGYINPITVSLNRNHTFFGFAYATAKQPPEPYKSSTASFQLVQVAVMQTAPTGLGHIKVIHWQSQDGQRIEGLLILPAHFKHSHRYPMIVALHGGPAGVWTTHYLGGCWEYGKMIMPLCWQDLLAHGFIIFEPNPRGSDGYGLKFRLAIKGDFGGKDYQDVMSGVDKLIKLGIADPNRLAIFGWSYGGYLTAWTISQTHQFKKAVAGSALTDLISFAGTTDIPYYLKEYLGGPLWKKSALYWQRSPLSHVEQISIPLMLISGSADKRVPQTQSQELYTALRQLHRSVTWLSLPQQGHVPTNPNLIKHTIIACEKWLTQI